MHQYTLDMVEQQLLQYFPSIQQKGHGLSLYYKDAFVEEVRMDSDGDLQVPISVNDTEGLHKKHEKA